MLWNSSGDSCSTFCPKGSKRSSISAFYPPRCKKRNIKLIRQLAGEECEDQIRPTDESVEEMMHRLTGVDIKACPKCGKGRLTKLYELLPVYAGYIVPNRKELVWDTS